MIWFYSCYCLAALVLPARWQLKTLWRVPGYKAEFELCDCSETILWMLRALLGEGIFGGTGDPFITE